MRTLILTVLLLSLIPFSLFASARSESGGLANRVAELEAQVEVLSAILEFVYVETEEMDGLAGPHWIIEGANVHVRSGSGGTSDGCEPKIPGLPRYPNCEDLTGLGNLVVGYNERRRGMCDPQLPPPMAPQDCATDEECRGGGSACLTRLRGGGLTTWSSDRSISTRVLADWLLVGTTRSGERTQV